MVSILVLNFNGKKWLNECLTSLEKTRYPNFKVFLIDNGSKDGSVEYSKKKFRWVKIIKNDHNLGFSKGYNRAIRQIKEEYVLLLNNDTVVGSSDWLLNLMNIICVSPKIAAVGAKLRFMDSNAIIDSAGGKIHRWTGPEGIGSREIDRGQYDSATDSFYVSGAAMLVRRAAFLDVEGFDEKMFAYSEDTDLCWRLRLKGYDIKYCPESIVYHYFSGSWKGYGATKIYLSYRNFFRSMVKNYSTSSLLRTLPFHQLSNFIFGLGAILLLRNGVFIRQQFKAIMWNIFNLKNSIKERLKIQALRTINDKQINSFMEKEKLESVNSVLRKVYFDRIFGRESI